MRFFLLLLTAIISYALGNLNGSILVSRLSKHSDVRRYGSGNAGLTNYFRTFGVSGMAVVIAIDVLKAVIAALIGGALLGIVDNQVVGKIFAGFCVIMGHMFPVLFQFKGGKGVLSGISMLFVVDWRVGLICTAVFAVIVIFTRYVSLGSVVGSALAPLLMLAFGFSGLECLLCLLCALLIIVKHAENIVRLIGGTENKLDLKKHAPKADDEEEMY